MHIVITQLWLSCSAARIQRISQNSFIIIIFLPFNYDNVLIDGFLTNKKSVLILGIFESI